jgi:hypothetical protein
MKKKYNVFIIAQALTLEDRDTAIFLVEESVNKK